MSIQGKLKGFLSDTVIYGVGSMFSRAFAFFLIPLYTGYLDKAQYANLILLQLNLYGNDIFSGTQQRSVFLLL